MNQQQQPTPKTGGTLKWLLIILVIIIILGGGYFLYQKYAGKTEETAETTLTPTAAVSSSASSKVSPSTAPIPADWKTYTSTTYSYLVKYPSTWGTPSDKGTNSSDPKRVSWIDFGHNFSIEILKDYTSIDAWVDDLQNSDLGKNLYTVKNLGDTMPSSSLIGGLSAKQLSTDAEGGAVRTGVFYGKYVYVLQIVGESTPTSTYNQILSSFDFTSDAR